MCVFDCVQDILQVTLDFDQQKQAIIYISDNGISTYVGQEIYDFKKVSLSRIKP